MGRISDLRRRRLELALRGASQRANAYDQRDEPACALKALDRLPAVAAGGPEGPRTVVMRAEITAQRGLVLAHLGYGASAVPSLQQGWQDLRKGPDDGFRGLRPEAEIARVQSRLADVQLAYGDPELAGDAAAAAVVPLLASSPVSVGGSGDRYGPSLLRALSVQALVRAAVGDHDGSGQALDLLRRRGHRVVPPDATPEVAARALRTVYGRVRERRVEPPSVTTRAAVRQAARDRPDLDAIFAGRYVGLPVTPGQRVAPDGLAAAATTLADLVGASRFLAAGSRLRIGLEAHHLFASAFARTHPEADAAHEGWRAVRSVAAAAARDLGDDRLAADLASEVALAPSVQPIG